MQFIALDLEWNNVYGRKIQGFFNEIIEFGAVKIDERGNIYDEFTCLINTQVGKKLRANTKELTHITNDEIKTGILFPQAVSSFKKWIGKEESVIMTWGDGDVRVLIDNCKYFGCGDTIPFLDNYMDLQRYFQRLKGTSKSQQIGLSAAAEMVGVSDEGYSLHRALDDSRLTALTFSRIRENKIIHEYIKTCGEDFYSRILFKNKVISSLKNPLVDKKQLSCTCEKCGKPAAALTRWKYSNQYFRAQYYCAECEIAYQVNVRFRKLYDRTEVRKIVKVIEEEETTKQEETV